MIKLGLTGSIAMGKSTTAHMFAAAGVPVYDADAAVHALYAGKAVPAIEAAFPDAIRDGKVDRKALGALVLGKPDKMNQLESIIHPLVREEEKAFLTKAAAAGHRMAVLDIPLLFETGAETRVHACVVVTAAAEIQRDRVLSRPGMSEEQFNAILARQMPDVEKRRRCHFLIDTGFGLGPAERTVASILRALSGVA